jgi:hypothetical protein
VDTDFPLVGRACPYMLPEGERETKKTSFSSGELIRRQVLIFVCNQLRQQWVALA